MKNHLKAIVLVCAVVATGLLQGADDDAVAPK
jgi:hypothetical protein